MRLTVATLITTSFVLFAQPLLFAGLNIFSASLTTVRPLHLAEKYQAVIS